MKHSHGHKPMHKMSHGGDMGGDGRTHRKIEKGEGYAVGGAVPAAPSRAMGVKGGAFQGNRPIPGLEKMPIGISRPMPAAGMMTRPGTLISRMKEGGAAKGGKWIQEAIKKPGALKKSLGVPAGEKIPAKKLEKASKAPGKMGQRARLAMTLKGMK